MKRLRSSDDLDSYGGDKNACKDSNLNRTISSSSSQRSFHYKSDGVRKGLLSSSSSSSSRYDRDRAVEEDREGSRMVRKRSEHDFDGFDRRKGFDRYRDGGYGSGGGGGSGSGGGGDRSLIHRSESFCGRREFPKGFRSERDRPRREGSVSSWRRGLKDFDESGARGSGRVGAAEERAVRSPKGLRDAVKSPTWSRDSESEQSKKRYSSSPRGGGGGGLRDGGAAKSKSKSPSWSKDSESEQSKSVEVKKTEEEVQVQSGNSSSEMEEGELEPEPVPPQTEPVQPESAPEDATGSEVQHSVPMETDEKQVQENECHPNDRNTGMDERQELPSEEEVKPNEGIDSEVKNAEKGADKQPDIQNDPSKEMLVTGTELDNDGNEAEKKDLCLNADVAQCKEDAGKGSETEKILVNEEEHKQDKGADLATSTGVDKPELNDEVTKENEVPKEVNRGVVMESVTNSNAKDKGKSISAAPAVDAHSVEDGLCRQGQNPDKGPIPPPLSFAAAPRFPPPKLQLHQDQASPQPAKTPSPNLVSPANGVTTGSPVPHLSTPPGPPVFSSPVRPAAVPFRTSPASPQPLAFSSSSSLPTSSSPQYSNGAFDLQSQVSDSIADHAPVGESSFVLFSAHKVLKQKKQANVPSLGFGALVSPGREVSTGPQVIQRDPHRCQSCGGYANIYCNILLGSGQWQCVICRKLNGSGGEYVAASKEDLHRFPELSSPMVDYVQTGNKRPGFVPVSDSRMSAPVVLVIDECLDEPHLHHFQSSLHAFVDSLPPTTRLGIVLYGRTVSVYDFSEESIASADVLPGDKSPSEDSLKALIYGTGIYLSPMHASLPVAHSIFSSLRAYKLNIPEASRDRCLGTAVEVALAIIQGPSDLSRGVVKRSGGNSRVIVCAGGPNTYGPGSVPHSFSHPNYPYMEKTALKWMENLGREAHRQNTVVDILCAGTCPVRVPILHPLAKASGGVFILHDDFGEAFGVNLQRASARSAGSHGLLELRTSDDILITQVVGPGEESRVDTHETFKNDTALYIQMLSVEETQCFSISMETKGDIKSDFVFFQFTIQYSNVYQADVSRVITVRLPTVDSVSGYLESVQDEVAAVLIAKRTLLRAKNQSDAIDMRATIDERIKDIALKFGSQLPKSKLHCFPKELSLLPEILFHLRRGSLLGSIIGHEDERSVLRNLFLNASFDLSLRMVAPRCLMHREGGTFEELPAYDLAMQSDTAVVLDQGTDVFIWLGAELGADEGKSAAALAACRTLAEELTEFRFPAPRILAFKEASSQARYFVSRLIPAHKDPPYEQEARFPQLRTLTQEARTKLKSSFVHFDDPSFCEWMRSLKVVPPQPR